MAKNDFRRELLPLMDLELDPTNPRIRLRANADRRDCIEQIAEDGDHLVALAKDISAKGLGLDPIVVEPRDGMLIVRDGNRRVSCLQMLLNPQLAPERIRRRIQRAADAAIVPENVECHVSEDEYAIREHMHRKHTGEGQGEGHRDWKTVEQARWEIDNGFPCDDETAACLMRYAEDKDIAAIAPDLPITTLTRFLNNQRIQQIGFDGLSAQVRPPQLNQDERVVVKRVCKIIEDLKTKHISVSRNPGPGKLSMMDPDDQKTYLAELLDVKAPQGTAARDTGTDTSEEEQFAGVDHGGGSVISEAEDDKGAAKGRGVEPSGARTQPPSWKRTHVASPVKHNGVTKLPAQAKKAKSVHAELTRLNVANFPNAAAVLVRMFVELSVTTYLERQNVTCKTTELRDRVKIAVDDMKNRSIISDPREAAGYKQHTSNEWISTQTLHGFVHHEFIAEQQIVNTLWDNMLPFLRHCWHS
ncbi:MULTISPECIES: hypothetical protein [unclassified Thioalkalivibrio]|uniref:hypothetical protein n=1 Tax=unclassified Thioalkalivibrio TaxID=2621013 RepID=UPI00039ECEB4|nr:MULTISPECIES: hypothetical protein [unclassified Thioalkalivibrio]